MIELLIYDAYDYMIIWLRCLVMFLYVLWYFDVNGELLEIGKACEEVY